MKEKTFLVVGICSLCSLAVTITTIIIASIWVKSTKYLRYSADSEIRSIYNLNVVVITFASLTIASFFIWGLIVLAVNEGVIKMIFSFLMIHWGFAIIMCACAIAMSTKTISDSKCNKIKTTINYEIANWKGKWTEENIEKYQKYLIEHPNYYTTYCSGYSKKLIIPSSITLAFVLICVVFALINIVLMIRDPVSD